MINFEFNWCSRLGAVTLKINKYCTIGVLRNIPTTFQLNPFSSVGGVVSTRFEFNRRGRLGAVTQKLSR